MLEFMFQRCCQIKLQAYSCKSLDQSSTDVELFAYLKNNIVLLEAFGNTVQNSLSRIFEGRLCGVVSRYLTDVNKKLKHIWQNQNPCRKFVTFNLTVSNESYGQKIWSLLLFSFAAADTTQYFLSKRIVLRQRGYHFTG